MVRQPANTTKIDIPFEKVLARLGYAHGKTHLDDKTSTLINEEIEVAKKLIAPKQVLASSVIKRPEEGVVYLEPQFPIKSRHIDELLKDCIRAYGFCVTIGPHLEEKRNLYSEEKESTRALVLDAIGSVAAEELAEIVHDEVRSFAERENLTVTRRFSPGYGDWPLSEQQHFLKWLGAVSIGIKLTQNFQMLPEKSVSAILGIHFKEQ